MLACVRLFWIIYGRRLWIVQCIFLVVMAMWVVSILGFVYNWYPNTTFNTIMCVEAYMVHHMHVPEKQQSSGAKDHAAFDLIEDIHFDNAMRTYMHD